MIRPMKHFKYALCLLALFLAGCALTDGSGNGTSQRGVGWSGSQNVQIGNNGGTKK